MENSFESLVETALMNAEPNVGWDFSYLDGRRKSEALPWSYDEIALSALSRARSVLDIDTGNGEHLRALKERAATWPQRVVATETQKANIAKAKENLSAIGIEFVAYEAADRLPFEDGEFDLVLNRHSSYSLNEMRRILRPGGRFITEQIGRDMCSGLNRLLRAPCEDSAPWHLEIAAEQIGDAELEIVQQLEYRGRDLFSDVGAIVWYLTKVPWQIPDFSIDRYRDRLSAIHQRIREHGPIDAGSHHFLIEAHKKMAS